MAVCYSSMLVFLLCVFQLL
ncbi:hypothetical protein Gotri_002170, partial [Gossypium trilobum]|nr:hypothetical protein [Gossypium trilobum]